jgi:hypothetical protein
VLRAEDNEVLTRVGPGTLMGDLLRRYWTPACLSAEIPQRGGAPARVRLLGDTLDELRHAWLRDGSLPGYGAGVIIDPDGTIHLQRGQWQATISGPDQA